MERSTDKASIICYHRRSKIRHHQNKNGGALEPKGILKNSEKPPVLNQNSGKKRKIIMSVLLPDDMIHNEILSRLPAKYIVRSRLVCKSWNSLLSNSEFIKSHLARLHSYPCNDEDLIIAKPYHFSYNIQILSHTTTHQVSLVPRFYGLLFGSINGLVCMSSRTGKMFRLWNPATAQLKQFFLPSQHPKNCQHLMGGFCWDSSQNDYKVVLVCYDDDNTSPSQLLIYSTNSDTWTQLTTPPDSVLPNGRIFLKLSTRPPSTIVKGIPYWKCKHYVLWPGKKRRCWTASVFKFLPETNEFRMLPDLNISAEHGKFLRSTREEWMTTMPENLHLDWLTVLRRSDIVRSFGANERFRSTQNIPGTKTYKYNIIG
ncbi:F-box domain-containing protein [Heracleum sosnowskyi]|uniref:F-box domain-containing protein n=1 Tax=Heracleum sosnowskyi TaxID=360622 RepID=A0AAD8MDI4_9APIA|nr:F-box domain-containing protein [Heracleum sosnowskyi]